MTYEYVCTACEHEWEASQPISAAPLKTCPQCQQETAKRQVSGGTGFVLKGGGWYSDLYSSASASKKKDGDDSAKSAKSDKSDAPAKKEASSSTSETKSTSSEASTSATA